MKKFISLILVILTFGIINGCATHRVVSSVSAPPEASESKGEHRFIETAIIHFNDGSKVKADLTAYDNERL